MELWIKVATTALAQNDYELVIVTICNYSCYDLIIVSDSLMLQECGQDPC
jgi:hypothetical protein